MAKPRFLIFEILLSYKYSTERLRQSERLSCNGGSKLKVKSSLLAIKIMMKNKNAVHLSSKANHEGTQVGCLFITLKTKIASSRLKMKDIYK